MINKALQNFASNKIKLTKKNYVVIIGGNPSKTARSPKIWNFYFKKKKLDFEMIPIDTKKNKIKDLINFLEKDKNCFGGCITVPFKEDVYKNLLKKKSVEKITEKIGAINCIYKKGKKLIGANTDGQAAIDVFKKRFKISKKSKCLIFGYGGAGKAVSAYFNKYFKNNVFVTNKINNSKNIIKRNNLKYVEWEKFPQYLHNFRIFINCTILGFDKNTQSPLKNDHFKLIKKNSVFFDVIYNPKITKFLKLGKINSGLILNGLSMNKFQAILAIKKVIKNEQIDKIEKILSKF